MISLPFTRKIKKVSFIILIFLIVIGVVGLILVRQNQDIEEKAFDGCKNYKNAKDCATACSPAKGKNNKMFKCRWTKSGSCIETSKYCDAQNEYLGQICPSNKIKCVKHDLKNPSGWWGASDKGGFFDCVNYPTGELMRCCNDGYSPVSIGGLPACLKN